MYDGDYDFFLILLGLAVMSFVVALVCFGVTADEEQWHESPNGCYIHEVTERHWNEDDKTTVTEFCPVK